MMHSRSVLLALLYLLAPAIARAELPPPPKDMAEWPMEWAGGAPGLFSAADLLDKPAGKNGPVIAREGHFYTGDKRVRFWGVNIAFGGCFPTHANADAAARRLATFGINAVRLHHMDMQTFPNGIFADGKGEKFSDEALDRLDYFVAALKKEGIYSNINLHVSRGWSKSHGWPSADQLPESYDKMLDIFHPDLIAANKQYAKDLLTHVNKYTNTRYADEPAVCMVEINNEDTLFLWGGEAALAKLPEPYAGLLQKLWNEWLVKKYGNAEKLKAAWAVGEQPLGENLLADAEFKTLGTNKSTWNVENHAPAKMAASVAEGNDKKPAVALDVSQVDGTDWHLQFNQSHLKIIKGKRYTVSFLVSSIRDGIDLKAQQSDSVSISVGVSQAHEPWKNLGLSTQVKAGPLFDFCYLGFTAGEDDVDARLSFSVGAKPAKVLLSEVKLREGGQLGLVAGEDPAAGSVARGGLGKSSTQVRSSDWYDFLQQTDEAYWVEMRRFLREEIGVKAPITGTIGLGPLGTLSQSKMDFVDAHAYWDHPKFPHRQWDMKDWVIKNQPMVDNPAGAALWGLAATRVADKPFTVTEYNHAAPNDWQAETIPMIASYAALQDWDGVFLFSYSHSGEFEKKKISSFFDVEGNPAKMAFLPLAARVFLGQAVAPLAGTQTVRADKSQMLQTASAFYNNVWPWAQAAGNLKWIDALSQRLQLDFNFAGPPRKEPKAIEDGRLTWTAARAGTGQFAVNDPHAIVFVGFTQSAEPIDLGPMRIEESQTPFVALMLVPANPSQTITTADRLLLAVIGRAENTGMKWTPDRRSVGDQWGTAPAMVEVVKAQVRLNGKTPTEVYAIDANGKRAAKLAVVAGSHSARIELGGEKTIWYEIVR